jgi:phosphopantetheine--protein transferase-like protein
MDYKLSTFTAFNRQLYIVEILQFNENEVTYDGFLSAEELTILARRKYKQEQYIFSRYIIKKIAKIAPELQKYYTVKYCHQLETAGIFYEGKLKQKLSLSHSGRFIAFCFCTDFDKVGVDVEKITDRKVTSLIDAFFSENDKQEIALVDNSHQYFFKLWTEKEAVTKLVNTSIFQLVSQSSQELHDQYDIKSIYQNDIVVSIAVYKND